jgi:hypothetical protein
MELNDSFTHRLSGPGQSASQYPDEYVAELTTERVWMLLRREKSLVGIGNRSATSWSLNQ